MKPYDELTFPGKLRRLHRLAVEALSHYNLKDPLMTYHAFETNLFYRVTTASGERFMLRLAVPGWRTLADIQSEALWLDALCRDTPIPVPRIIPASSGELVLPVHLPDVPQVWNVILMSWVPGRLLGRYLTPPNLERMGELFAALHQHGAAWVPPAGFTTRRFEHWISRGEENLIVQDGQPSTFPTDHPVLQLSSPQRDLLERLHHHVEAAYAAISRLDLRVIHCDLWHDNIKLHQGQLHPIDFEDTVWGFRAHDIAMAMLDLLEDTDDTRYAELLPAFRRGYEAILAFPTDSIEPFQIGRLLWKINWVARRQPQRLLQTVERHTPVLEHYEQTGQVIKPPPF